MSEIFDGGTFYTGAALTAEMLSRAEDDLNVRLPRRYVEALYERNGGSLKKRCFPTKFPTSWAADHFAVDALLGIGGEWGIDSTFGLGSSDLIKEWGYPDIGVVIAITPSAGHDTVMLDYSEAGSVDEPHVVYVDQDRVPRRVADSFQDFLEGLVLCEYLRA